jgi:membrane protein DedA with SNARE-associated domain
VLLGTGIGWVIGFAAASAAQPADSAVVLTGAGIGSFVGVVEASEAWHVAGVGSEVSSGALLAAGRYFLEMRLHSKSAVADASASKLQTKIASAHEWSSKPKFLLVL